MKRIILSLKATLKSQNWKVILVAVFITGLACSPIYYHRIALPVDSDYGSHVVVAQQLLDGEGLDPLHLSHPIMQLLLAAMHLASGQLLGLYASTMILQVLVQIATVLILYFWIGPADRKGWDWLRAAVAITLTFVSPLMLLAFEDGLFYNGYISLANYHNPTIHLLKPFALLSFFYALRALTGERSAWKGVLLAAFLTGFSALIKPSYIVSILPALALAVSIRCLQRRRVDWKLLTFGFYLPGILILVAQWLAAYVYGDPGEGMIFAPFLVVGAYSQNLLLKFLLSILFPLLALLIARRNLWTDSGLLVGWTGFLAGAAQMYLLAEGGLRVYHGNFVWSGQIMLFLLFAVTVRWLLREKFLAGGMRLWEKIVIYGAYLAHFAAGIAYYIHCMVSIHYV